MIFDSIGKCRGVEDIYGLGVRDRSNLNRRFFDASEDSFYGRSVCSNLRPIIERDW